MKRYYISLLIFILLFSIVGLYNNPVTLAEPSEVIELRTLSSKTFYIGDNPDGTKLYSYQGVIGSIHYKDDIDDPFEQWKDIETDIVSSNRPNWDWEVVKGNWRLLINDNTTVALINDGNWIGFQYQGFAYYDTSSQEYVILDQRRDVTPVITNNKIRWEGIFYGVNLEYIYNADEFKENLEITQQARDWLSDHPPSIYGLNNQTSYLTGYIQCDWSNSYPAENEDGQSINFDSYESDGEPIFWRNPVRDKIINALPIGWAMHDDVETEDYIKIRHKFFKHSNGNNYLLFGSKVIDLNQFPDGTIIFDPTVVNEQVAHGYDDAHEYGDGSFSYSYSPLHVQTNSSNTSSSWRCAGWRFQTVNIPQGSTIDTADMEIYVVATWDDPLLDIYGNDVDDANNFYDEQDVIQRVRTSASVEWDEPNVGTNDWATSPEIKTIIQEIVDRGSWVANNNMALMFIAKNSGFGYVHISPYESSSVNAAKLNITYSAGGVSVPTVTSDNSSSVEETSATLNGNITDTGGENADYRGFEWDTDSGAPYSSNTTESGSFSTGIYDLSATSLSEGTKYYWRAMAHNTAGWGYGSELTLLTKPLEPTNLTATGHDTYITLTWDKGTGADNTTIYGKEDSYPTGLDDGDATLIYSDTGTSANHTSLDNCDNWYYRAWSYATDGDALEQYSDAYDEDNNQPIPAPTTTTNAASSVEETTATLSGNVTISCGVATTRGFEWDTDSGAPYSSNWTEDGSFSTGEFTHGLTSLTKGELYYFRAISYNNEGWGYGDEDTFLTKPDEPDNLTAIAHDTYITLTWSNGTGSDNTVVYGKEDSYPTGLDDGDATLVYDSSGETTDHTSLDNCDNWYYRAWSWTSEGGKEQYSDAYDEVTAIPAPTPTLVTNAASSVDHDSALLSGNITTCGNHNQRGFEWDTDSGAPYSSNWTESAGGYTAGIFTHNITSLNASTTYYFRAMAYNPEGWGYGAEGNFTTSATPVAVIFPEPPQNFAIVQSGANSVNLTWLTGAGADTTIIRYSDECYPISIFDGWEAYEGSNEYYSLDNLSLDTTRYYYTAWSENSEGLSRTFTRGILGGENMILIAQVILVLGIMVLVFWRRDPFLYIVGAGILISFGVYWASQEGSQYIIQGIIIGCIGGYFIYEAGIKIIRSMR